MKEGHSTTMGTFNLLQTAGSFQGSRLRHFYSELETRNVYLALNNQSKDFTQKFKVSTDISQHQGWSLNLGTTVALCHQSALSKGQQHLYFKELHSEY